MRAEHRESHHPPKVIKHFVGVVQVDHIVWIRPTRGATATRCVTNVSSDPR